jgi:hypothetical protein
VARGRRPLDERAHLLSFVGRKIVHADDLLSVAALAPLAILAAPRDGLANPDAVAQGIATCDFGPAPPGGVFLESDAKPSSFPIHPRQVKPPYPTARRHFEEFIGSGRNHHHKRQGCEAPRQRAHVK